MKLRRMKLRHTKSVPVFGPPCTKLTFWPEILNTRDPFHPMKILLDCCIPAKSKALKPLKNKNIWKTAELTNTSGPVGMLMLHRHIEKLQLMTVPSLSKCSNSLTSLHPMGCSDVSELEHIYGQIVTTPSCVYTTHSLGLHEQEWWMLMRWLCERRW